MVSETTRNDEYVGFSIQLFPTNEQKQLLAKYFGASRYVYNWALDMEIMEYEKSKGFLHKFELNNLFTQYKKKETWLNSYDSTSLKIIIFDLVNAFERFFNRQTKFPKYKSRKNYIQSMALRSDTLTILQDKIRAPGIGWIRCGHIPNDNIIGYGWKRPNYEYAYRKYCNPRITCKGDRYILSFTLELDYSSNICYNSIITHPRTIFNSGKIIGIDLGCKGNNWIVDSEGSRVSYPDTSKEDKKIKHLQKELSRKILHQRTNGEQYIITNNIRKTINRLNKYYDRKANRKKDKIRNYIVHDIIDKNPAAVVIEDIKIDRLIHNPDITRIPKSNRKILNRNIMYSSMYEIRSILEYVLPSNNIRLIVADNQYKSTQLCSKCGSEKHMGSKRKYNCPVCGISLDRDYNAAINLSLYPYRYGIDIYH